MRLKLGNRNCQQLPRSDGATEMLSTGPAGAALATQSVPPLHVLRGNRSALYSPVLREDAAPVRVESQAAVHACPFSLLDVPTSAVIMDAPSCISGRGSDQQISRSTSLARGSEDACTKAVQPHLLTAPVLGALDYSVNSRLLANLRLSDVWWVDYTCSPTRTGQKEKAGPTDESVKQTVNQGAAWFRPSRDTEYFEKSFINQFMKPEEAEEFMGRVDIGGEMPVYCRWASCLGKICICPIRAHIGLHDSGGAAHVASLSIPVGHGKISRSMFIRSFMSMYTLRSALLKSLEVSVIQEVQLWGATSYFCFSQMVNSIVRAVRGC